MFSIENDATGAPASAESTEVSLEDLALIFGGSGMVGMPTPKPGKTDNNGTSSGGGGSGAAGNSGPYEPPLVIPNIPSEPIQMFDPGPFFDNIGGGY